MLRALSRLLWGKRASCCPTYKLSPSPGRSVRTPLGIESLEDRWLLSAYSLDQFGQLWWNNMVIDRQVQSFVEADSGMLFDLHSDGRLFRLNADTTLTYLDGGVQGIAGTGGTSVFDLHSDGKLYLQNADTTWHYLDGGVQAIAGTGGTSVFDLHSDGRLYSAERRYDLALP